MAQKRQPKKEATDTFPVSWCNNTVNERKTKLTKQ